MASIVVVGVASLYLATGVAGEFPLEYAPVAEPDWMRAGVTGSAAHIAKVLRALGDDVRLCTLAGTDPAGLAIRADLRANGLSGEGVVDAGATWLGVVLVAPDGSRMGLPYMAAVSAVGYPAETFHRLAAGADLAVLTNARFCRPLSGTRSGCRSRIAVDVHLISDVDEPRNQPWLEVADILFCSHERLPCAPREWVARVFARYPGMPGRRHRPGGGRGDARPQRRHADPGRGGHAARCGKHGGGRGRAVRLVPARLAGDGQPGWCAAVGGAARRMEGRGPDARHGIADRGRTGPASPVAPGPDHGRDAGSGPVGLVEPGQALADSRLLR